jgi:hypothetical protein
MLGKTRSGEQHQYSVPFPISCYTSRIDAAKYLDREITMYNYSSSVLAEAIKQVLVAENDIYIYGHYQPPEALSIASD